MTGRFVIPGACSIAIAIFSFAATASAAIDDARFEAAVNALSDQKPQEAIAGLEAIRDEGTEDAAVSFDLGLAYLLRARIQESPGDLGRAVHALEEAKALTKDPQFRAECTRLSGDVRAVVAKRRARVGLTTDMEETPPPARALSRVLSEDTWATISLVLSAVIFLALFGTWKARGRLRVASSITLAASAVIGLVAASSAHQRKVDRESYVEGIIVSDDVRPTDERHIVLADAPSLSAGTKVQVEDRRAGYARIRAHKLTAYVPDRAVLSLPIER